MMRDSMNAEAIAYFLAVGMIVVLVLGLIAIAV